ncbi:thioredoxin domain-containing protein [Francisellaceae bacterium CB300]
MKKIITAILGVSTLALSSCSTQTAPINNVAASETISDGYVDAIATPVVIKQILADDKTPTLGSKDAKQAVVVFFDYACGRCTEISKQLNILVDQNPSVKFIFKAYPSNTRDAKVANYATLAAYEAYLQGGQELFKAYNKAIFAQRDANGKLTNEHVDAVIKQLGVKVNQEKLKQQAIEEELESRKLGKIIGFNGPHSMIILPTNLADMSAEDLVKNKSEIYVLPGSATKTDFMDHKEAAKIIVDNVSAHIKNM